MNLLLMYAAVIGAITLAVALQKRRFELFDRYITIVCGTCERSYARVSDRKPGTWLRRRVWRVYLLDGGGHFHTVEATTELGAWRAAAIFVQTKYIPPEARRTESRIDTARRGGVWLTPRGR